MKMVIQWTSINTGRGGLVCEFCKRFDWGEAHAEVMSERYAHIVLSLGSGRFPVEEQFCFCPVCVRRKPNIGAEHKGEVSH